jgi:hypothetical protein
MVATMGPRRRAELTTPTAPDGVQAVTSAVGSPALAGKTQIGAVWSAHPDQSAAVGGRLGASDRGLRLGCLREAAGCSSGQISRRRPAVRVRRRWTRRRRGVGDGRDDVPGDLIMRAPERVIVEPREVPQVRCRASATGNRTAHQMPDRVRRCSQAASTQMHRGLVLGADEPESFGWILASGPSPTSP